jgi:Ca2+-binding RTX toxin-like protein
VQENAAPTAIADTVIMSAGTNPAIFLASALLANDTDPELDALQVVGAAGSGVSFNAGTGLITLTDPTITSFTYQMEDATHAAVAGTVTVQKVIIGGGNTADTVNISSFTYAASYIDAANGGDSVTGGGGVNWFLGGSGADLMIGSGANDTLSGEQDNDRLIGNGGADSLMGGAGTDTLTGGAGDDILRGDNGSDRFVFTSAGDGADTIQDFGPLTGSQPDRIDLSAIDAIPGGLDNAFSFVAVQNGGTVANSVTWQVVGGVTVVRIDADGIAGAEVTITLAGGPSLGAGDFIL